MIAEQNLRLRLTLIPYRFPLRAARFHHRKMVAAPGYRKIFPKNPLTAKIEVKKEVGFQTVVHRDLRQGILDRFKSLKNLSPKSEVKNLWKSRDP